jgi:hypothetical protein
MRLTRGTLVLCCFLAINAVAQEAAPRPSYGAVRAATPPAVDGDLSDPVWQDAPAFQ